MKANDAGDVFPLWGTCNGFEILMSLGAGGENVTSPVDAEDYSVPLNLSLGWLINFACLSFTQIHKKIHNVIFWKGVYPVYKRNSPKKLLTMALDIYKRLVQQVL